MLAFNLYVSYIYDTFISTLIYPVFTVVLAGAIASNSVLAITKNQADMPYKQAVKTCLELINYIEKSPFNESEDSCLVLLGGEKPFLVRKRAEVLERIGFRHFPKDINFISNNSKNYGYLDNPQTIDKPLVVKSKDRIRVTGWAILPDRQQQPTLVLLSLADKKSFFATAYVSLDSPDVAKALKSNQYSRVRWAVDLPTNYLPIAQTEIKAWVYNPVDNQFVKLRGGAKVTVEDKE